MERCVALQKPFPSRLLFLPLEDISNRVDGFHDFVNHIGKHGIDVPVCHECAVVDVIVPLALQLLLVER